MCVGVSVSVYACVRARASACVWRCFLDVLLMMVSVCFLDGLVFFSGRFGNMFWMFCDAVWMFGCFLDISVIFSVCVGNVFWLLR